jgi:hypothetical protein
VRTYTSITDTLNEVMDSDDCVGEVEERIDDNVAALVAALPPVEAVAPRPSTDTIHGDYNQV